MQSIKNGFNYLIMNDNYNIYNYKKIDILAKQNNVNIIITPDIYDTKLNLYHKYNENNYTPYFSKADLKQIISQIQLELNNVK